MSPPSQPPLPPGLPADWPHRDASRRIDCGTNRWHVQIMGTGPVVLMLHGAGASGHSFAALMDLLAPRFTLIVPDLPGQGFTRAASTARMGLEPMARDLAQLIAAQGWDLAAIIGHSAGAAIALRLAQILPTPPRALVGINPALGHFRGLAGWLFPVMARALAQTPGVASLFARTGRQPGQVERVLASTGSALPADDVARYRRLIGDAGHVRATLAMMSQWTLDALLADLPRIDLPCLLIAGAADTAVPPDTALEASSRLPRARAHVIEGYGHLIHEEAPTLCADLIVPWLAERV